MKLSLIALENFGAFRGRHEFSLDDFGGKLVFVSGENRANPELGSNGAGKSTLLDSLCWCIYGQTAKGVKAAAVESRGVKGTTAVDLTFESGGKMIVVRRERPRKLFLNGEVVEQEAMLSKLGMPNWDGYCNSVFFSRTGARFFEDKPAGRLATFSELLNLDAWDKRASAAKANLSKLQSELEKVRMRGSGLARQIASNDEKILAATERMALEEARIEAARREREGRMEQCRSAVAKLEAKLTTLNESKSELGVRGRKAKERADSVKAKISAMREKTNTLTSALCHRLAEKNGVVVQTESRKKRGERPDANQQADMFGLRQAVSGVRLC